MTDRDDLPPETEDDALEDVEQLGGDPDIMESLPDEGSPIESETEYDALEDEYAADDDAPQAFVVDEYGDDDEALYQRADPYADFMDIDAALASVATLSDQIAEREAAEQVQAEIRAEQDAEEAAASVRVRAPRALKSPPPVSLRRGQPGSVVPAFLLIGVGAWLTFAVASPGALPMTPTLVAAVLGVGLVLALLAYWLMSGRWSRGALFFAVLALGVGAAFYVDTLQMASRPLSGALTLLAVGAAFALTGILARPAEPRLLVPGAMFAAASAVVLLAIFNTIPPDLLTSVRPFAPVVLAVIVILWLLPVVLRRRG